MEEVWVDIIGYEGKYKVSNKGNVVSVKKWILMKQRQDKDGYLYLGLFKDGKARRFSVHRLVAIMFVPNPENKAEVNHKNYNKQDNYVENLEWATRKENAVHSREHYGIKIIGEGHYAHVVTNSQAKRMIFLRSVGLLYREIALIYNIKFQTCRSIIVSGYSNRAKARGQPT